MWPRIMDVYKGHLMVPIRTSYVGESSLVIDGTCTHQLLGIREIPYAL